MTSAPPVQPDRPAWWPRPLHTRPARQHRGHAHPGGNRRKSLKRAGSGARHELLHHVVEENMIPAGVAELVCVPAKPGVRHLLHALSKELHRGHVVRIRCDQHSAVVVPVDADADEIGGQRGVHTLFNRALNGPAGSVGSP